jgi:hypothetical protein
VYCARLESARRNREGGGYGCIVRGSRVHEGIERGCEIEHVTQFREETWGKFNEKVEWAGSYAKMPKP